MLDLNNIELNIGGGGPFLSWQARPALDGSVAGRCFVLRSTEGKRQVDLSRGFALNLHNIRTGWCHSDGIAGQPPQWKWNDRPFRFGDAPGPEWKRGFSVDVMLPDKTIALWEQAQAAAMSAMFQIIATLRAQGELPADKWLLVQHNGDRRIDSGRGTTYAPVLEIVKWVDAPAESATRAETTPPAPPPTSGKRAKDYAASWPLPAQQPASAPKPRVLDDDIPW